MDNILEPISIFNTLLLVGTTLDKPLYYVNSMRILMRTGLRFYISFTQPIRSTSSFWCHCRGEVSC